MNGIVYVVAERRPNDQGDAEDEQHCRANQQFFCVAVHQSSIRPVQRSLEATARSCRPSPASCKAPKRPERGWILTARRPRFGWCRLPFRWWPRSAIVLRPAEIRVFIVGHRRASVFGHASKVPHDGELANQQIRTSPSAHLQLLGPDFSQGHLQPSRPRMNCSFGAAHPDTDRSYPEARERQPPQLIIVGLRPWSRIEMGGFCHRSMPRGLKQTI